MAPPLYSSRCSGWCGGGSSFQRSPPPPKRPREVLPSSGAAAAATHRSLSQEEEGGRGRGRGLLILPQQLPEAAFVSEEASLLPAPLSDFPLIYLDGPQSVFWGKCLICNLLWENSMHKIGL